MNKLNVFKILPMATRGRQNIIQVTNADSAVFSPGKADSAVFGCFFELEYHFEVNVGVF